VYALYGAAASLVLAAAVAFFLWPSPATVAGGSEDGAQGGGFAFGPAPVEVVVAIETMAAEPVSLIGTVAPVRESLVASEVEGRVAELLVDEGDRVRAGDVLVRLDTTTAELELSAARAGRAEAAARMVRFESEVRRISDLRERGAISEREYEQALADRDAQTQALARLESEAARLAELIDRAEIRAPFAGQVAAVHAELGEWSERGGDVVTLMDLSEVEVTVNSPQRYVSEVEQARLAGVDLGVEFDALSGRFSGRVKAIVPQANPQARTFPVIIVVPNAEGRIRAGMSARVLAQVGAPIATVLVPKDALVLRSGRTFVFRTVPVQAPAAAGPAGAPAASADRGAPGGTADASATEQGPPMISVEEVEVAVGNAYGAWQVVRGGIRGGDEVVVRGNESLRPGAPVVVSGIADIQPPPTVSPQSPPAGRESGR
jgi:RND family efflux transporter MFP subunit